MFTQNYFRAYLLLVLVAYALVLGDDVAQRFGWFILIPAVVKFLVVSYTGYKFCGSLWYVWRHHRDATSEAAVEYLYQQRYAQYPVLDRLALQVVLLGVALSLFFAPSWLIAGSFLALLAVGIVVWKRGLD